MSLAQRLQAKMDQMDLGVAEAAREIGISHSMLSNYLNGKSFPNRKSAKKIGDWLGLSRTDVEALGNEGDERHPDAGADTRSVVYLDTNALVGMERLEQLVRTTVEETVARLAQVQQGPYTDDDFRADEAYLAQIPGLRYDLIRNSNPSRQTIRELARAYREEEAEVGTGSRPRS